MSQSITALLATAKAQRLQLAAILPPLRSSFPADSSTDVARVLGLVERHAEHLGTLLDALEHVAISIELATSSGNTEVLEALVASPTATPLHASTGRSVARNLRDRALAIAEVIPAAPPAEVIPAAEPPIGVHARLRRPPAPEPEPVAPPSSEDA